MLCEEEASLLQWQVLIQRAEMALGEASLTNDDILNKRDFQNAYAVCVRMLCMKEAVNLLWALLSILGAVASPFGSRLPDSL